MGINSKDPESEEDPFKKDVMDIVKSIQLGKDPYLDVSAMNIEKEAQKVSELLNIASAIAPSQIAKKRYTRNELVVGTATKIAILMGAKPKEIKVNHPNAGWNASNN